MPGSVVWSDSPTPGRPVDVDVEVHFEAIQQVDPRNCTASLIYQVRYYWHDPRVAAARKQDPLFRLPKDLWKPGLCVANGIRETEYTVDPAPTVFILDAARGLLRTSFVCAGEVTNTMALKGFPFDEDSIDIRLCGMRLRDGEAADASDFVLRPKGGRDFVKFMFDDNLPEFRLLGLSYIAYKNFNFSYITIGIIIRRKHIYYFYKVTILMWLIVLLTMPTFLFDFAELEQRMALTSTMFLATAATLFVVGQDLPKTEYLNKMDRLLLGTIGVLFAVGAESILVFELHKADEGAMAEKIENAAQWLLPLLYVLLNIVLFACPVVSEWRRGGRPAHVREERAFIPWADVMKVDPWAAGKAAEIMTSPTDRQEEPRATQPLLH